MKDNFKIPKTPREQIEYLKDTKNVIFNDITEKEAEEILLKYKYINVITPYKYLFAKKDAKGNVLKDNGCHIYENKIDFNKYYQHYLDEISQYYKAYISISNFERIMNAIVCNNIATHYNLCTKESFYNFINSLKINLLSLNYSQKAKERMLNEINDFENQVDKYDSIFIFLDRISLSDLITIFRTCDIRDDLFRQLLVYNCTYGFNDFSTFDNALNIIVQIRNCVCHNSITVLIRYYSIKNKQLRSRSDVRRYANIYKKMIA